MSALLPLLPLLGGNELLSELPWEKKEEAVEDWESSLDESSQEEVKK